MKFSDIRQLYAVYVHFIAFLDKLLVEQALEKVFFYGFFFGQTPSEINQNRIRNLKYLATTERKGGIKVCENSMDMCSFTSPFHIPHECLPHTHGVRESTSFEWSV